MIDLNKKGFIEEHLAGLMGGVLGAISGERAHNKAAKQHRKMEEMKRRVTVRGGFPKSGWRDINSKPRISDE